MREKKIKDGNCVDCFHSRRGKPSLDSIECEICIRNPNYPSKRMPKQVIIEGVELEVPQDMYIAKDRKVFEEEKLRKTLVKVLAFNKRMKRKKKLPFLKKKIDPWDHLIVKIPGSYRIVRGRKNEKKERMLTKSSSKDATEVSGKI